MIKTNNGFQNVPNLGKVLIENLNLIDINTIEKLKILGSKSAFIKLKTIDNTACINMLYALEGAIEGIRWHYLNKEKKRELLEFFNSLQ